MRELTQKEIDLVSADPTLHGPVSAAPTIIIAVPSNLLASVPSCCCSPYFPLPATERTSS